MTFPAIILIMNECMVKGCHASVKSLGMCVKHYTRQRRYGTTDKSETRREQLIKSGFSYCPKCKTDKLISSFSRDKHAPLEVSIYCRDCQHVKARVRYVANPDAYKHASLIKKFGLSLDEYRKILEKQNGKCAICGFSPNGKSLAVDHNHKTGNNRGLLCDRCNFGLGNFRESREILESAIRYLDSHMLKDALKEG